MISSLRQRTITPVVDDIEWPVTFAIDAYGFRVQLRASHRTAADVLRSILPPGAHAIATRHVDACFSVLLEIGDHGLHRLYEGSRCVARDTEAGALFESLRSRLHFAVAVGARDRLFVHAGAVGWYNGAILIPGHTHAGKSTLVAALVRAGATYYSDEYAVLDASGLVHPFARPLGIRDPSGVIRSTSPASLGGRVGRLPLPVRRVVFARYVPQSGWWPQRISCGETVLGLLEHTVAARSRSAEAVRILCAAAENADALRGSRGEAERVADQILSTC